MRSLKKIGILLIFTYPCFAETTPSKPAGTIASLSGVVKVRRVQADQPLKINEAVFEGDSISTEANGAVKILFSDNSIMDLGPNSMFRVENFKTGPSGERSALLTVFYGRLRALVTKATSEKSKLEVRTPDSVMGVRGTEFIVRAPAMGDRAGGLRPANRTEMTVVSGKVAFGMPSANQTPVLMGAGAQISTLPGSTAMPAPIQLNPAQLKGVTQIAVVKDNTFDRTVTVDSNSNQNDKPNNSASTQSTATSNLAAATASLKEGGDAIEVSGKGTFGLLDTINNSPAILIPGNLKSVNVTLSH